MPVWEPLRAPNGPPSCFVFYDSAFIASLSTICFDFWFVFDSKKNVVCFFKSKTYYAKVSLRCKPAIKSLIRSDEKWKVIISLIWPHSVREFGRHFGTRTSTSRSRTRLPTSFGSPTQHGRDALQFVSEAHRIRLFHYRILFLKELFNVSNIPRMFIPRLLQPIILPCQFYSTRGCTKQGTRVNYFINKERGRHFNFGSPSPTTLRVPQTCESKSEASPSHLTITDRRTYTLTP